MAVVGRQVLEGADMSSATALTVPAAARSAWLQATGDNVRFEIDGETDPTGSSGMVLTAGDPPIQVVGEQGLRDLKVIRESASSELTVFYFGSDV